MENDQWCIAEKLPFDECFISSTRQQNPQKIGIHQIFMRAQLLWNHFHSLGSRFMGSHNFSGSFEGYFVGSVMEIPLMNIKQMIVIKFVGMLIHGQRLP